MKKWNYDFDVPEKKKVRIIIHTDAKNEADDQYAIAHHLMTPKFIVRGIIGAHFNLHPFNIPKGQTAAASTEEIHRILDLMGLEGDYPVYTGSEYPLCDEQTPQISEGAEFIIEEAMRDDERPLYIACQGSLTDVASAILMKPEICDRMTVITIGGAQYPEGGFEFNFKQDIPAANVIMKSTVPVWQVPMNAYKQVSVTLAQLQLYVKPHGRIGRYLFEQMVEVNDRLAEVPHWPHGELWGLGDSPTIGVLLYESEKHDIYDMVPAPEIENSEAMPYIHGKGHRAIRVYKDANARLTLDDFFAKLAINFPNPDD